MVVIAGHLRLKAAQSLGMAEVPVHVAVGLSDAQIQAYRIADNRVAEEAEWDRQLLTLDLGEIRDGSPEFLDALGFDNNELAALMGDAPVTSPAAEWQGMPELEQPDATAFRDIVVHFLDQAAVDDFAARLGQDIAPEANFMWHPEAERGTYTDKRYAADKPAGGAWLEDDPQRSGYTDALLDRPPPGLASWAAAPLFNHEQFDQMN